MALSPVDSKLMDRFFKLRKATASPDATDEQKKEFGDVCAEIEVISPGYLVGKMVNPLPAEEKPTSKTVALEDFLLLLGSLKTLYRLARLNLFKYASAAGVEPEEMDNMHKVITDLNTKYNG